MYFKRDISEKITSVAGQFPVVVLTGARQAGKTTLLKKLFPDYRFVSLDLPSQAHMAESEPALFFQNFPPPLLIDEVQYAPGLFRNLKMVIDDNRHAMGQFILTGSQKFTLMKAVSDSLAGRAAIFDLENLRAHELSLTPEDDVSAAMARGFYPELWRQPELERSVFYPSYIVSYLERDIRQVLEVRNLRDFERFIRACAVRSGQLLNMSDLGRDVGIRSQTAREWLGVLEASNQISLLEPYFENVGKRNVKSPKLYFNDPGMLCYLLGLEPGNLTNTPLIGAIFEALIYAEFRKRAAVLADGSQLYFYRDGQGREIDFLHIIGGKINLLEAKWSENPGRRWADRMDEVAGILSVSKTYAMGEKTLLCRTPHTFKIRDVWCRHVFDYFRD
ncbi:MAG: DUF4143 domain-containing protein [Gammaproteobacteria bacterium]|nr:DUF4143 domain-containing protein [Gammaproteobacteria bacterium]